MSAIDGLFTVNDVIIAGLRKSGIVGLGQYSDGADILDAQNDLSDMLAQWNVKTWLTFAKLDMGFTSDGRIAPYTIGPGANFNVTQRPDRIEASYVRILGGPGVGGGQPVDQPLRQIAAREQYASVALKRLVAFPKAYFYDTSSPTGNVYFYPWPSASIYEMHVILKNAFPLILPLNLSLVGLPAECRAAMKFCLARRLRQAYGKGLRPDPELNALAKDAEATMRNSHVQVPELVMPKAVLGRGNLYNIYGDTSY